jgi:hypothetical protein
MLIDAVKVIIMLGVIMPNVVILSVVAPQFLPDFFFSLYFSQLEKKLTTTFVFLVTRFENIIR